MKHIKPDWNKKQDDTEREARAQRQHDEVVALAQSPGWKHIAAALEAQVTDSMNDLARTSIEDEQNRGVIRALKHVLSMPDQLVGAASKELDKHR